MCGHSARCYIHISSSSYDDSTTTSEGLPLTVRAAKADSAPQGSTAHAAKVNIDPEDLLFDPTKANDDPEVYMQYFKFVLDSATNTPCSSEWKKRWIRHAITRCAKEVCRGCKKLIVVQYKCPSPCDPYYLRGQTWHRACFLANVAARHAAD